MEKALRRTIIAALAVLLLIGTAALAAPPAALEPLAFLLGEWVPIGGAAGGTVFSRDLQDGVIVRRNFAEYPASDSRPASRHDDLMVIHAEADGAVRADYYDSEGHVIRYLVTVPRAGAAVFLGEAVAGQPRFRLTYDLAEDGALKGEFAIATPNAPEAFQPYLSWSSRRSGDGSQ